MGKNPTIKRKVSHSRLKKKNERKIDVSEIEDALQEASKEKAFSYQKDEALFVVDTTGDIETSTIQFLIY